MSKTGVSDFYSISENELMNSINCQSTNWIQLTASQPTVWVSMRFIIINEFWFTWFKFKDRKLACVCGTCQHLLEKKKIIYLFIYFYHVLPIILIFFLSFFISTRWISLRILQHFWWEPGKYPSFFFTSVIVFIV